jgi:signal peptidase I
MIRPRKPASALLMSLVLPGFGQLYNGEINKAAWVFLAFALLVLPGVAFIALHLPAVAMLPALLLATVLALGLWIYAAFDAWRAADRLQAYRLSAWQVSGVYAFVLLLCDGLILPATMNYIRAHQVASYRIPSVSMEPGILPGDILFADQRYNCPDCASPVQRGDVAIFVYKNDRTRNYIKRVIALPGDLVRLSGHTVWVNGKSLTLSERADGNGLLVTETLQGHQWQVRWHLTEGQSEEQSLLVPAGQAFVLGDNRSQSSDTREFGTVPLEDISGKARQVWLSVAPGGMVRWDRLGHVIQ